MDAIDELYDVREVNFSVGDVVSTPGQNMGSARRSSASPRRASSSRRASCLLFERTTIARDVLEHPDA